MIKAIAPFTIMTLCASVPAIAGNIGVEEARSFIVGHPFTFTCLQGISGEGRVNPDGSVVGTIRLGPGAIAQNATLPSGTLRVRGDAMCAAISGLAFEPCFELDRIGTRGFRGSAPAIGPLASCQFLRKANEAGVPANR